MFNEMRPGPLCLVGRRARRLEPVVLEPLAEAAVHRLALAGPAAGAGLPARGGDRVVARPRLRPAAARECPSRPGSAHGSIIKKK